MDKEVIIFKIHELEGGVYDVSHGDDIIASNLNDVRVAKMIAASFMTYRYLDDYSTDEETFYLAGLGGRVDVDNKHVTRLLNARSLVAWIEGWKYDMSTAGLRLNRRVGINPWRWVRMVFQSLTTLAILCMIYMTIELL